MIYHPSLPQTIIVTPIVIERTPVAFTAVTPLPALVSARRNGKTWLACVDKVKDFNGHLFARVQFADEAPMWTNADNIVEVVG